MKDPRTGEVIVDPETGRPIADPANLEAAAEDIRKRLATRPVHGQVKTPDSIVEDLEWQKWAGAQSPAIVRDADRARKVLTLRLKEAAARVRMQSTARSADLRDAEVLLGTLEEQMQADAAEIAYDFARAVAREVERTTSATQSQLGAVKITYDLAGSGRGHG